MKKSAPWRGLLFVATGTADAGIKLKLSDGLQQRDGLRRITRIACGITQAHAAAPDRLRDRTHDQALAQFGSVAIAEFDDFSEVVAGIDMYQGKRKPTGTEGLLGDAHQHHRILAAGKQQRRFAAFGRNLAHDVDRF